MSANHNRRGGGDDFDSVGGSRGSSGTQSPWRRDSSPSKPTLADQHPDPQDEDLAHVGAGANTQPADRNSSEKPVAHRGAVAPTRQEGTEESRAVLQAESQDLSHNNEPAGTEEGKSEVPDLDDEIVSMMDMAEQEEDRGDLREQPKPQS